MGKVAWEEALVVCGGKFVVLLGAVADLRTT
jgi:hypothetical protein